MKLIMDTISKINIKFKFPKISECTRQMSPSLQVRKFRKGYALEYEKKLINGERHQGEAA